MAIIETKDLTKIYYLGRKSGVLLGDAHDSAMTDDSLHSYDLSITEISITGDHFLTRLLSSIWMGFYVAYYLAIEYERDPSPVKIIENLKKQLK